MNKKCYWDFSIDVFCGHQVGLIKESPLKQKLLFSFSVSLMGKHQASSQLPPKYLPASSFLVDELCFLPSFQGFLFLWSQYHNILFFLTPFFPHPIILL